MPLAPLPFQVLAEIALAVVDATDLQSAFDLVASELSALFDTRAMLFEKRSRHWVAVAGADPDIDELEWQVALNGVLARTPGLFSHLNDPDGRELTAISLTAADGPEIALVADGDWTADRSTLKVFALLVSMGLDSLRLRRDRHAAGQRLIAGYAMARRWSRLASVDSIAQQVVDQIAGLVAADRVSLSLYNESDDALSVVATHGYALSDVADVRISPGAWIAGHVFSRARPIFVADTRLFPGTRRERYRTQSFAVVPLLAGSETIGVLAVTEKRDRQPFSREDETVLRGMSVIASLAIVAARTKAEAAKLAYAATVDSVSHLLNRPYFDSRMNQEVERTKREGTTLAVLIGDIDDFKLVNDSFGHQVGDEVLKVVGGIVRSAVRVFDVCARYGGDEFAVLMPNCDRNSALACAERIRLRIAQYDGSQHGVELPRLTVSIGAAVIEKGEEGPAVMARADRHLYQAKADGKNVVRADSAHNHRKAPAPLSVDLESNGGWRRDRSEPTRPAIRMAGQQRAVEHDGDKIMKVLADKTRHLSDAPGIAVYLKAPGDTAFRTLLSWAAEDSIPHVPHALPRAFNHVVETGRAVMLPDIREMVRLDASPHDATEDARCGLVAVPVMFATQVVGAICIFDVEPLTLADHDLATLSALGRDAFTSAMSTTVAGGGSPLFRDRAVDRRLQTVVAPLASPARIEWPAAILERTGGEFAVARELARARREGRQLSVVLFDVGPAPAAAPERRSSAEGLEVIADTLLRAIRQSDLPIRWSLSELLLVLPGLKGNEARMVAERVRAALQAGSGHRLNVSGGVAELENEERFADVVDRAREKVAMAVGRGHNRVV